MEGSVSLRVPKSARAIHLVKYTNITFPKSLYQPFNPPTQSSILRIIAITPARISTPIKREISINNGE